MSKSKSTTFGPIEPVTCYPLRCFQARTGLGDTALRSARRPGLVVRRVNGRAFIMGADFIDYLNTLETGSVIDDK